MAATHDGALRELSILIRTFELVFRKLIRLLIGKISLRKIQELISVVFVEEAEAKLKQQRPGKNVALADLALLADVDTMTIKRTRSYIELSTPLHQDTTFLSELIPESCVLDVWGSKPKYVDHKTGKAKTLKIKGPGVSFESLIKESTATAGVSADAYLQHLADSKSIRILAGGNEVQLINAQYTPFGSTDHTTGLKIGLAVVSNLLDTVTHNLLAPAQGKVAFYQRGCWTTRLSKKDRQILRNMTRRFLSRTDEQARELIEPYERDASSDELITAGISMFYFEEEKAAWQPARNGAVAGETS